MKLTIFIFVFFFGENVLNNRLRNSISIIKNYLKKKMHLMREYSIQK